MIYHNNPLQSPYSSSRVATFAQHGMVATSQPLAAAIGVDILKQGGNAVDAAVATAAALTVVEPTGCGIGGDAFAQVWIDGKLYGLNASSTAPELLTVEQLKAAGHTTAIPKYGWFPVTVPGIPRAWASLNKRFGKLPFSDVLKPAIDLARSGFPVSPTISLLWQRAVKNFTVQLDAPVLKDAWLHAFAPKGRAPSAGELFAHPELGDTLQSIADSHGDSFYQGELADKIDAFARASGGLLRKSDLEPYQVSWVDPIHVNYRGYDVWQIPPNSQGLVVLMALNILKGFDFDCRDSIDTLHKQVEALKLAYTDGQAFITQLDHMPYSVEALLAESFAQQRRQHIAEHALMPQVGSPQANGTVYLATADGDGTMVSFIQSNFHGFGSGVVIPGTGISLQNRGCDFSLNPNHPNFLQAGKRTFHTIIPGFISHKGVPLGPFGVMGAYMQPQGQLQVLTNMIDFGMNPQAALDARVGNGFGAKNIGLEFNFPADLIAAMKARGHRIDIATDLSNYGRGQIIYATQIRAFFAVVRKNAPMVLLPVIEGTSCL